MDDPNIISDHSILRFTMPISVANEEIDTQEDVFESVTYKYVWKRDNIDSFKNNLSNSYGVLNGIQERLTTEQINNECIDEAVDVLVNTLKIVLPLFEKICLIQMLIQIHLHQVRNKNAILGIQKHAERRS